MSRLDRVSLKYVLNRMDIYGTANSNPDWVPLSFWLHTNFITELRSLASGQGLSVLQVLMLALAW